MIMALAFILAAILIMAVSAFVADFALRWRALSRINRAQREAFERMAKEAGKR
jgi:hypothetical protein